MAERVDARRDAVKLYTRDPLNDDWQDAQIKLGSGLNEYGQSQDCLQAQVGQGMRQPAWGSWQALHAWKAPHEKALHAWKAPHGNLRL